MMLSESGGLPFSGGIVVAGLIYAGVSMFVTGALVGDRTIEKSGWLPRCERTVLASATANQLAPQSIPQFNCGIMGQLFGADSKNLCDTLGEVLNPLTSQIATQERRLVEANRRRIAAAASRATSACTCAINVTLEKRVPWTLYAGSFRLIKPSTIGNLDAELMTSLNSPFCRMEGV